MRQMVSHLGPGPSHNGPNSGAQPTPNYMATSKHRPQGLQDTPSTETLGYDSTDAEQDMMSSMMVHRMNLCDAPDCPCGAPEQTADHIINDCTKYQCPGLQALSTLNSEALAWLADTSLVI